MTIPIRLINLNKFLKRATGLLSVCLLLLAATSSYAAPPNCKGKPPHPPECDTGGEPAQFYAAFTSGPFKFDPSPLRFVVDELNINQASNAVEVILKMSEDSEVN